MILSIEIFLGVGTVVGWFVYKGLLRFAAWGRAKKQQKARSRAATDQEIARALRRVQAEQYTHPR